MSLLHSPIPNTPSVDAVPSPTRRWHDLTTDADDRLLTIAQVARLTCMSTRFIGRHLASGRLPRIKLGRATRIRLSDVQRLIERGLL